MHNNDNSCSIYQFTRYNTPMGLFRMNTIYYAKMVAVSTCDSKKYLKPASFHELEIDLVFTNSFDI